MTFAPNQKLPRSLFFAAAIVLLNVHTSELPAQDQVAGTRSFTFNYGGTVTDLPDEARVQVWVPVAKSNAQQQVNVTNVDAGSSLTINPDDQYGNLIGYFEATGVQREGQFKFRLTYDVQRAEAAADGVTELSAAQRKQFLAANRLVPTEGRPTELVDGELPKEANAAGSKIYNIVQKHMKYDKSKPGYGNGDATWACDSKTGNCTDFHSLFISLARSQSLPARFEIGFPLPPDQTEGAVKGYHCWAWFFDDSNGWTPVDISEADKHPEMNEYYFGRLTPDRIAFSTGRDIELIPRSAAEPLNYFIYPHVEVDGKPWPKEKIKLDFSFRNR
jgi:transglutaminase-like putative cysteine protease